MAKTTVKAGDVFGRLTVIGFETRDVVWAEKRKRLFAHCLCTCGGEKVTQVVHLRNSLTMSCGCLNRQKAAQRFTKMLTTHGATDDPLYSTHAGMMVRCHNERSRNYRSYGGRGILVCTEWHDFLTFRDYIQRNLGPRPDGHSLDRINNSRGYEPGNVRWASAIQQCNNTRRNVRLEVEGIGVMTLTEAARAIGMAPSRLRYRIAKGKAPASVRLAQAPDGNSANG